MAPRPVRAILNSLRLLLPAIVPSWRFFDESDRENRAETWIEFRPKPAVIAPIEFFNRLFWNPVRNEDLFLISCAERLLAYQSAHSQREIFARLQQALLRRGDLPPEISSLRFRLILVERQGDHLVRSVAYQSPLHEMQGLQVS
jgi:hypothetical protein